MDHECGWLVGNAEGLVQCSTPALFGTIMSLHPLGTRFSWLNRRSSESLLNTLSFKTFLPNSFPMLARLITCQYGIPFLFCAIEQLDFASTQYLVWHLLNSLPTELLLSMELG